MCLCIFLCRNVRCSFLKKTSLQRTRASFTASNTWCRSWQRHWMLCKQASTKSSSIECNLFQREHYFHILFYFLKESVRQETYLRLRSPFFNYYNYILIMKVHALDSWFTQANRNKLIVLVIDPLSVWAGGSVLDCWLLISAI